MGDTRSPTLDFHHIFKIPKTKSLNMGKVYKSFVFRRSHDHKKNTEEPITPSCFDQSIKYKRVDEDIWSPKSLSRTASRRSKTPTPSTKSLSRHGSRRCTTPNTLSRSSSRKRATEIAASSIKRIMSRRGNSDYLQRSMSKLDISEPELIKTTAASRTSNDASAAGISGSSRETDHQNVPSISLSCNSSRRATTPIIFSQTTARKKGPEVEKTIHCTLEDLCFGCIKKIKVTRDVIKHPGVILQEEEVLQIEVKPGWRKGTKIRFEGKGDEKPGYLPADIVFLIEEKEHHLFRRDGNNLEIGVEIPLVDALTGCSLPIPLLGGESVTVSLENTVVHPGYEKVVEGQGMPNPKNNGKRGDLLVNFFIDFPTELSDEQRKEAFSILQDCC